MSCLTATVSATDQRTLGFSGQTTVELGLRVADLPDVRVELCEARGAVLSAGAITATVGQSFELFFRLSATTDARVLVELFHLGADANVPPFVIKERFGVSPTGRKVATDTPTASVLTPRDWLSKFTEPGIRQFFEHLSTHGTVTESEACHMLEGQRALRKFAREFEALAKNAPFSIRIDVIAGVKRYVREGST